VLNLLPVGNYLIVYVRNKIFSYPSFAYQQIIYSFIKVCFTLLHGMFDE
jgi:hypothetical protein